jgi:hypothetical protein
MDVYRARTLAGWRKFLRKGSSGACGRPTRATARLRFSEATTLLKRLLVRADELIAGVSQKVPPKTLRPRRDVRRYVLWIAANHETFSVAALSASPFVK